MNICFTRNYLLLIIIQYLDTASEIAEIDKEQIIEIVKNNKNKKIESVINLLN